MSIFNAIFGKAPDTSVPPPTPPQSLNNPTGAANPGQPLPTTTGNQVTDNNGLIPVGAANPPGPAKVVSPLDPFNDLWNTVKTEPGNDPNAPAFTPPDPAKIMEAAKKVDFSRVITPDHLAKITAGGEGAAKALVEMLQATSQLGYAQSAMATSKIVEAALNNQKTQFESMLPSMVRKLSVNDGLSEQNPLLSNPAIQPLVGAMTEQLTRKNPNASAKEISDQVSRYFNAIGTEFGPKPVASADSRSAQDWSKFLE